MWNRFAWLAGAVLALAAFSPLRAQTVNPDCTGIGLSGPGVNKLFCLNTGCGAPKCVVETTSTPWGVGTGRVCRCNYIGPPPDCCRLVLVKFAGGGVGYTTQGQCNFVTCNDWGNCKLGSKVVGPNKQFEAYCLKNGEAPQYGSENLYRVPSDSGAFQGYFGDEDADGDGEPDPIGEWGGGDDGDGDGN